MMIDCLNLCVCVSFVERKTESMRIHFRILPGKKKRLCLISALHLTQLFFFLMYFMIVVIIFTVF